MPHSYETRDNGIIWTFTGDVTFKEVLDSNFAAWNHPKWSDFTYQIVDFLNVQNFHTDHEDSVAIAYVDRAAAGKHEKMRVAIAVTNPEMILVSEQYKRSIDMPGWEVGIFPTIEAATEWATSG